MCVVPADHWRSVMLPRTFHKSLERLRLALVGLKLTPAFSIAWSRILLRVHKKCCIWKVWVAFLAGLRQVGSDRHMLLEAAMRKPLRSDRLGQDCCSECRHDGHTESTNTQPVAELQDGRAGRNIEDRCMGKALPDLPGLAKARNTSPKQGSNTIGKFANWTKQSPTIAKRAQPCSTAGPNIFQTCTAMVKRRTCSPNWLFDGATLAGGPFYLAFGQTGVTLLDVCLCACACYYSVCFFESSRTLSEEHSTKSATTVA